MKTLNQHIKESILDDEEDIIRSAPEALVEDFILKNYDVKESYLKIKKSNDKYIVNCKCDILVKNYSITQLTNELFEWGEVDGFYCSHCNLLTSLQGSPEKVEGYFRCSNCTSLTSLEGAPEKVGWGFDCSNCESLTTLKGAPKKVGRDFSCHGCESLTSLKGAPKEVGGGFICYSCGTQFKKEDVEKVSKVKGKIYV